MTSNNFIKYVKQECKKHGVILKIGSGKEINYGSGFRVAGYFTNDPPLLACASNNNSFLSILVHESCHMDQYLENDKLWVESCKKEDDDLFDGWITNEQYPLFKVFRSIDRIQQIELDCEKRSVKKIIKFNLPINIQHYIKDANSYLFLYTFMKEKRKWPSISPGRVKEIIKLMPDKFLKDYSKLSPELYDLYNSKCYKK